MRGILTTAITSVVSLLFAAATHPGTVLAHSAKRNALNYVSRVDEPDIHTPSHRAHAYSSFQLTFLLHNKGQSIRLALQPNHDVLADTATVKYVRLDGSVQEEVAIERAEHKVFKGDAFVRLRAHSEWTNAGWARIVVYRDGERPVFEGAFRLHGNQHHIQTATNYRRTQLDQDPVIDFADDEYMVVWRDSDIRSSQDGHEELKRDLQGYDGDALYGRTTCASDQLRTNNDLSNALYSGLDLGSAWPTSPRSLFARQIDGTLGGNGAGVNLASTIGSTAGCPTTRKVALIGIAADCSYVQDFASKSAVSSSIISMVNTASAVYETTFNLSLGIQNLTIVEAACPDTAQSSLPWNTACSGSISITDRLNQFSRWRGQFKDTNAYWTLLSKCQNDAAVGLAWLGAVCSQGVSSSSGGSNETSAGANIVIRNPSEWQVFAHESGHTFGAVHDCVSSTCSDDSVSLQKCCPLSTSTCDAQGRYLMNPSTGSGVQAFSPCSVGNICSALARNNVVSTCLMDNKGVRTITDAQCGNGIVESGEDCDCGGEQGCGTNNCCDAKTCKFKSGAVCDPSNEECCNGQCQFASNGTVCRASTGQCDPQEVCSGTSPTCPPDSSADEGKACGADGAGLSCASGQCTSRDLQCRTYMGTAANLNDTYACQFAQESCTLTCASASLPSNRCYDMQQYFLDGTPCGGGGRCRSGQCQGSNYLNEAGHWIEKNKHIVIPVASVVGGLILIALLSCMLSSYRRRSQRGRRIASPPNGLPNGLPNSLPNGPPNSQLGGSGWQGGPPPSAYYAAPPPPVQQIRSSERWA